MKLFTLSIVMLCFCLTGYSQTYTHYYGNIHAHTAYSDGNKDKATSNCDNPACSFELAKNAQNYDFMGISEHNHHEAGMSDKTNWYKGLQTAIDATTSDFVALYGLEWGTISNGGHVIIYGYDSIIGWDQGLFDVFNAKTNYNDLFKLVSDKTTAFAYLAHPERSDYNDLFKNEYDSINDNAIVGIAHKTGPALGINAKKVDYSAKPSKKFNARFKDLLKKGYHVAPGIDHDTHYSNFGKATERRLVVLAKELTQEALMDAFRSRRFYASEDFNFKVDFTIGEAFMGEIFNADTVPEITINLSDEDNEGIVFVKLYYGEAGSNENPKFTKLASSSITSISLPLEHFEPNKEYYYYLDIKQEDKDRIITAPIWFTLQTN